MKPFQLFKIFKLYVTIVFLMSFSKLVKTDTECPNVLTNTNNDRRKDKSSLRLVQYNTEWLFIDYYAPMDCPGSGCTWKSQSDAETHLFYVVSIIKDLNPDIINICEIEGCDELQILKSQLDTTYNPYLKKGTDTGTGQNVGLLTKIDPIVSLTRSEEKVSYPINGTMCGTTTAYGTTGVSKHYITEFKLDDLLVAFIGAHLLAIPTDPSRCVQREAQAQVLQNVIANYITKGYEVILIGDMNDYDNEVVDLNNNKPTSRVLDIMKGIDGQKKGTYNLTNIAYRMKQEERFSDWWDSDSNCDTSSQKDYSMIDHILVTQKIDTKIVDTYIYHGYNEYCGKWNSDHFPVVVDFKF
jgi:exonuclease III